MLKVRVHLGDPVLTISLFGLRHFFVFVASQLTNAQHLFFFLHFGGIDDDGSQYFFNSSTGETTWDRPTSPEAIRSQFQSLHPSESSEGPFDVSPVLSMAGKAQGVMSPTIPRATPKRQSSVDDNMLQSQLLGLSLSEEELHALVKNDLTLRLNVTGIKDFWNTST